MKPESALSPSLRRRLEVLWLALLAFQVGGGVTFFVAGFNGHLSIAFAALGVAWVATFAMSPLYRALDGRDFWTDAMSMRRGRVR